MRRSWPLVVGLAIVGSASGVLIAGRADPVDTVATGRLVTDLDTEPITVGPAIVGSTTIGPAIVGPITVGPITIGSTTVGPVADPTVADPNTVADPTTTIVQSSPVLATAAPGSSAAGAAGGPATADRSTLRVVIADAADRTGPAELTASRLANLGYGDIRVGTATSPVEFTVVYFRSGFNRAAVTVAQDLNADDPALEELPADSADPLTDADDSADVIVLLGADAPD